MTSSPSQMSDRLDEAIEMIAVYPTAGGARPVRFRWKGRVYPVHAITHKWVSYRGAARLKHFGVISNSGDFFELCYDPGEDTWTVVRVDPQS